MDQVLVLALFYVTPRCRGPGPALPSRDALVTEAAPLPANNATTQRARNLMSELLHGPSLDDKEIAYIDTESPGLKRTAASATAAL
jgi:hypothetical protein